MQTKVRKQVLWRMRVRSILNAVILSLTCLLFIGCATPTGKVNFPEASPDFKPKRIYSVSYDKMWDVIDRVLEENRITITTIDKSTGRITTDYIQGGTTAYMGGLAGIGNSRYKYNIRISQESDKKVRISIIANLEQSLTGSSGSSTPYRDLSQQNMPIVNNLENWLYEQIEKAL